MCPFSGIHLPKKEGSHILKPFIPWVGGKTALRPVLYRLFPNKFDRIVEVFGGGAAVLFGREPDGCEEVYNDRNSNLVNLFACVKERPIALMRELGFLPLNSREEFTALRNFLRQEEREPEYLKEEIELCKQFFPPPDAKELEELLTERAGQKDIKRAAAFYKLIQYSYAGGGSSFGGKPKDIRKALNLIQACSHRLAKVVIENQSYEHIIRKYNKPGTLLYLDPPYYQAECYEVGFGRKDHLRLRRMLRKCKCFFVLSYNDHRVIRELYKGFWIFSVKRLNNLAQRYDPGSEYAELIITNYDPRDHPKELQMTLFQTPDEYEYTLIAEGEKR